MSNEQATAAPESELVSDTISHAPPPLAEPEVKSNAVDTSSEAVSNKPNGRHSPPSVSAPEDNNDRPAKKIKLERAVPKGTAPIKAEFLLPQLRDPAINSELNADDRSKGAYSDGDGGKKTKNRGQNTKRDFGSSRDAIQLCLSRTKCSEFAPDTCAFGDKCKFEHDLRKYLREGKRQDLDTFGGTCPVFKARGECTSGWRCRFATSHSEERLLEDGRKELVLLSKRPQVESSTTLTHEEEHGVVNIVSAETKIRMRKKQIKTPKSDAHMDWLRRLDGNTGNTEGAEEDQPSETKSEHGHSAVQEQHDNRANYKEPPFLPSEKRKLYYGPETPILAPLTTQGNLPFRRLCVDLGAQVTWSEMAMGLPLIQGEKPEWALLKAHESELLPPACTPQGRVVKTYDNAKDLKFGAQIAGNKPWITLKTTEILTSLCPNLRAVDLNCGCPIDLVYRQGAGSALLDSPGKLERILRGMNAVSNEVPVTVKIRMGTKDNKPTATRLVSRLAFGGEEASAAGLGPAGVAAIALHGRSRQQRYTRSADWEYISECAAVIESYRKQRDAVVDTVNAPDPRHLPASAKQTQDGSGGELYFIGNGDVYSHADYYEHLNPPPFSDSNSNPAAVDAVMIARGALLKPWIFEEVAQRQYLDKSSSQRLEYIAQFARYGLEAWGSDEVGVGTTRRFLLEWLSFACRYVPVGMLERLPPRIQDRPPAFQGRDEMETLLSSDNYKDWIKISEMFLGPAHKDFKFEPKHKSSMPAEAEG